MREQSKKTLASILAILMLPTFMPAAAFAADEAPPADPASVQEAADSTLQGDDSQEAASDAEDVSSGATDAVDDGLSAPAEAALAETTPAAELKEDSETAAPDVPEEELPQAKADGEEELEQCPAPVVGGTVNYEGLYTYGNIPVKKVKGYTYYYSCDGTDPTASSSKLSASYIHGSIVKNIAVVDQDGYVTIKVVATKEGMADSEIVECRLFVGTEEDAPIADENLKSAILDNLGYSEDEVKARISVPLKKAELLKLQELHAASRNISKLDGLEAATNLRVLDLSGNAFAAINPRKAIWPVLEEINLSNCGLNDSLSLQYLLSAVSASSRIKKIDLSHNKFKGVFYFGNSDLRKSMSTLEELDLSDNDLIGFQFQSRYYKLSNLKELNLTGNRVYLDENSGNWYASLLAQVDIDQINVSDQKPMTDLLGVSRNGAYWNEGGVTVDLEEGIIDLGSVDADSVTLRFQTWQDGYTTKGSFDEEEETFDIAAYDANYRETDTSVITRALKPGENTWTLHIRHISGQERDYQVRITSTQESDAVPDAGEESAGIHDVGMQKIVVNKLNQGIYKEDPKSAYAYDVTQADMASLTGTLTMTGIRDLSGIEYAENLTGLNVTGTFGGEIDLSKLTKLTTCTLTGEMTAVKGVQNLTALKTLSLAGEFSEVDSLEGLTNLTTLTLRSDDKNIKTLSNVTLPANLQTVTVSEAADGTLPNWGEAQKIKTITIRENGVPIQWGNGSFAKLSQLTITRMHHTDPIELVLPDYTTDAAKLRVDVNKLYYVTREGTESGDATVDISGMKTSYYLNLTGGTMTIKGNSDDLTMIQATSNVSFDASFRAPNLTSMQATADSTAQYLYTPDIPKAEQIPSVKNLSIQLVNLKNDTLPDDIGEMKNLKKIHMYFNSAKDLGKFDLHDLDQLEEIYIYGCTDLKGTLYPEQLPESLTSLTLYNSPVKLGEGDWTKFTKLTTADLTGSRMTAFPYDFVRGIPSLTSLKLVYSRFTTIPEDAFENSVNLTYLSLGALLQPYIERDGEWVLDPESDTGKAIETLKKVAPNVQLQLIHDNRYGLTQDELDYSILAEIQTEGDAALEGDPYYDRNLSLMVPADTETVTIKPIGLLPDTSITAQGQTVKSGEPLELNLAEAGGEVTLVAHNDYQDDILTQQDTTYTIRYTKGSYIENFEPETGKVYEMAMVIQKEGGSISMSNAYFRQTAEVRMIEGGYDVRITTDSAPLIPDIQYELAGKRTASDIVADSGNTRTYRFYTDSIDKRLPVSLLVVPMGNVYKDAYISLNPNKTIDVTALVGIDKADLLAAISKATAIIDQVDNSRNVYTRESYEAMNRALAEAREVEELKTPSEARVAKAAAALNDAIEALVIDESKLADKSDLKAAIDNAKKLTQGAHTDTNWQALQEAIQDAEAVYDDIYATTKEAASAAKYLNNAIKAFNSSGEASTLDPANLADGVYSVYVDMINVSNQEQKSMSDGAVTKPITITVKNGTYTATVNFHGLNIPLGNITMFGYMKELAYWDGSAYVPVTVDSTYDVVDDFNDANGDGKADYLYPHQMSFPLVNRNNGDDENGYVHVQVFVPIMESISTGTGTQQALMKIDWTSLKKGAAEAEDTKKEDAPKVVKGKTYTVSKQSYKVTKVATAKAQGTVTFTKAKNAKNITVPATVKLADGKTYKVTQVAAKAFTGSKIRKVTVGKNVTKLAKNAFAKSKAATVVLKTKSLKKSAVKGSLKGSKVKTVQIKVGSKSANKKTLKSYKKIFTKANAGRKVTVK